MTDYLALFIYDISLYLNRVITIDSEFLDYLCDFFSFCYNGNEDIINKILGLSKNIEYGEEFIFPIDEECDYEVNYLTELALNQDKFINLINNIDNMDIIKINDLVPLFVNYVYACIDIGNYRIRH